MSASETEGSTDAGGADVARILATNERLRESDERYRALLQSVDDGFAIIDLIFDETGSRAVNCRFLEVNASFERQSGFKGATGKTAREISPDFDETWYDTFGRVALTGEIARFERYEPAIHRTLEGEAIRVGAPEKRRVAILFRDVTARKRAEAAQKEVQEELRSLNEKLCEADRRKDEFIGMLAHELRNPLAPVRNAVEILRRLGSPDPQAGPDRPQAAPSSSAPRALAVIERQVGHMARLVDDLLDVSRIARGKLTLQKQTCDIAEIARQTAEDYRASLEQVGLRLVLSGEKGPVWVEGDAVRLAQMVANLLHNSSRFTESGGLVEVRTDVESVSRAAVVSVRDTGIGIDPALLSRLFDPFSQADQDLARSKGGLGLGLALTKGLAELHGGGVDARSEGAGRGATFSLRIPLSQKRYTDLSRNGVESADGAGLRVLLVEDNRDAAETLGELLELGGFHVRIAFDGTEALAAVRSIRPDAVISDIGLPGELDGYSVARAIRADPALAGVPLIALSGYASEDARRRSREAGFDAHLAKPADIHTLERMLSKVARRTA